MKRAILGFTLLELLVAMMVFSLLLVLLVLMLGEVNRAWVEGERRVESFQNGRAILELISRELSQAVISDKLQLVQDPKLTTNVPSLAVNSSSIFWQAPLAATTNGDLAIVGYFLTRVEASGTSSGKYQLRRLYVSPTDTNAFSTNGSYYTLYSTNSLPTATNAGWVDRLPTAAFMERGESGSGLPAGGSSSIVSDGIVGFWVRCLDSNGNPIPWLSTAGTTNGDTSAAPLKFNSAAYWQPAVPGSTALSQYTAKSSTIPAHRLPAAIELTLVTVDSRTLRRNPVVPFMSTTSTPQGISSNVSRFLGEAQSNGINSARVFSTVVRLVNSADVPAARQ